MQPWPVWYPTPSLVLSEKQEHDVSPVHQTGSGTTQSPSTLIASPPPPYENGCAPHRLYCVLGRLAEWRIMGWLQDVHGHGCFSFFSVTATQWRVQGVKMYLSLCFPMVKWLKAWFTETSYKELSLRLILIKEGVNWWKNYENEKKNRRS